jgi:hypothetical protein
MESAEFARFVEVVGLVEVVTLAFQTKDAWLQCPNNKFPAANRHNTSVKLDERQSDWCTIWANHMPQQLAATCRNS